MRKTTLLGVASSDMLLRVGAMLRDADAREKKAQGRRYMKCRFILRNAEHVYHRKGLAIGTISVPEGQRRRL